MRKGVTAVRAHAALALCLAVAVLAVTGGGVYAVLAGTAKATGEAEAVSTAAPAGLTAAGNAVAEASRQWFQDMAAAHDIPLPETARAEALATPPPAASASIIPDTVVRADTPSVMPVHLPTSVMSVQQFGRALPGLHISAQARARAQRQLDSLADTTVGITTAAVNQGTEASAGGAAESSAAQKDTGGEQGLGLDLVGDFDTVMSVLNPGLDPLSVDINGVYIDGNGEPSIFSDNGIPDRSELMIVQKVLNTPGIDFSATGGVSHAAAVAHWQAVNNAFQPGATPDPSFTPAQQASLRRVVVGYCMLGDLPSVELAFQVSVLSGVWVPVDEDAVSGLLIAPQPWPFSIGGDFTGQTECGTTGGCTTERYGNYAKWNLAQVTARLACPTDDPPCDVPPPDAVSALYGGMLDGDTCDQKDMLVQIQESEDLNGFDASEFHFHSVTVETQGQFISPSAGRLDYPAGNDVTLVAWPDTPWIFDHWEVTPPVGEPYTVTTATLTIPGLDADMAVRAVSRHDPGALIYFDDRRLEQAVRTTAGKLSGDLRWGDVDNLQTLDARGLGITRLGGLQYLSSLTYLDLRDNGISQLTPLGALTEMRSLFLGHNNIVQSSEPGVPHPLAPLAGMTQLELLDLGWGFEGPNQYAWTSLGPANHLRNVAPLASIDSLASLDLCGNDLESLEGLSNKASLQFLLLDDNPALLNGDGNGNYAQNLDTLGSMGALAALFAENTGLTDTALHTLLRAPDNGDNPRLPALFGIALSGNPAITTLEALAPYAALQKVKCWDNPGLSDISALGGKTALNFVFLVNTAITNLGPLTDADFHDGCLVLRNNALLHDTAGYSVYAEVGDIELAARHNTVDRDFACGTQVLLTLSVSPPNAGSLEPAEGAHPVALGITGGVQAVQTNPNYIFSHWSGDAAGTDPVVPLVMDCAKNVTAVFAAGGDCSLTMLEPEGAGSVTPAPGAWACRLNEHRQITATPKPGWVFLQWTDGAGQLVSYDPTWEQVMNGNRALRAEFLPTRWTLTMSPGVGVTTVPAAGRHDYRDNAVVAVSAEDATGACFAGWSGAPVADATARATTITMNSDHNLGVSFVPCSNVPLTVVVQGPGHVTPGEGTQYYEDGDTVTLDATPWGGSGFVGWIVDGKLRTCEKSLSVAISAAAPPGTIIAEFDQPFEGNDFQRWLTAQTPTGETVPGIGSYMLDWDPEWPPTGEVHRYKVNAVVNGFTGYDMPDLVWLIILNECMTNGPYQAEVAQAYWGNVQAWHTWLDGFSLGDDFPSKSDIRIYAAYCTLSEIMKDLAVAHFKSRHPGVTADPPDFTWVPELALDKDADGDGFSNIDEWLFVNWRDAYTLAIDQGWDPKSNDFWQHVGNWQAGNSLDFLQEWYPDLDNFWNNFWLHFVLSLSLQATAGYPAMAQRVPNFYSANEAHAAGVPTVQITINTQGWGYVTPGPGTFFLPKYSLSKFPPGAPRDCTDCELTSLAVRAEALVCGPPFQAWLFTPDMVPGAVQGSSIGKNTDSPTLDVPLDQDRAVTAYFTTPPELALLIEPPHVDPSNPASPPPGKATALCAPIEGGGWDFARRNLTARATERAWRFSHWEDSTRGDSTSDLGTSRTISLALDRERTVRACFTKSFYLPDDLNTLVTYVNPTSPEWQTATLALSEPSGQYAVPDVISMAVMQYALDNGGTPMHQAILDAYEHNYDVILAWFDEFESRVPGYERPEHAIISALAASAVYECYSFKILFYAFTHQEYYNYKETIPNFAAALAELQSPTFGTGEEQLHLVPQMTTEGDVDGDGFSNLDEWFYFEWKNGNRLYTLQNWDGPLPSAAIDIFFGTPTLNLSSADKVPVFSVGETGAPPTVQVTISKEGEGSTSPAPNTYSLPKYRLTRWWKRDTATGSLVARSESEMTAADFATLTVHAVASDDWQFDCWRGGIAQVDGSLPDALRAQLLADTGADPAASKSLPLVADWQVCGTFKYRPGIQDMDSAGGGVAALVEAAGEATQAEFLDLSYDKGELSFDENGDWLYTGNGIPDAAEVALLGKVLGTPGFEYAAEGGASSEYVWRSYTANYDMVARQLPGHDTSTLNAVAALLTLGDLGHALHAVQLVKEAYGVEMSLDGWKTGAFRWFGAKRSVRAGELCNRKHWEAVVQSLPAGDHSAQTAVRTFIGTTTGIILADNAFPLLADYPANCGLEQDSGGGSSNSIAGDCGCWNDGCAEPAVFKVQSVSSSASGTISAAGYVESPAECGVVNPNGADGAPVQVGREVKVTAGSSWFTSWEAPGTPIEGSFNKEETFIYSGATVKPAKPHANVCVYYDPIITSVSAGGGDSSPVLVTDTPALGYCNVDSTGLVPISLSANPFSYSVTVVNRDGVTVTKNYALAGWKLAGPNLNLRGEDTVGTISAIVIPGTVSAAQPVYTCVGTGNSDQTLVTVQHCPIMAKGGYVMADKTLGTVTEKHWLSKGEAFPLHQINYTGWPFRGYVWKKTMLDGGIQSRETANGMVAKSTTGTGDFEQVAELTVDIAGQGDGASVAKSVGGPGSVRKECMGYYTVSPAQRYYDPYLPAAGTSPALAPDDVTVTAEHRSGYVFSKWVGVGEATYVPFMLASPVTGRLDDKEHPITCDTITLAMDQARQVEAVFEFPYQSTCPEKMHPSTSIEQSSTFAAQSNTSAAQSSTSTAQSGPNVTPDKVDVIRDPSTPGNTTTLTFPRGAAHATLDRAAMLWVPDYHLEAEIHWRASGPAALNYAATITDIGQSKQKWCAMAYFYDNYPCFLSPGVTLGMCLSISEAHEQMHIDQIQAYIKAHPIDVSLITPIPYACMTIRTGPDPNGDVLCTDDMNVAALQFTAKFNEAVNNWVKEMNKQYCSREREAYTTVDRAMLKSEFDANVPDPAPGTNCTPVTLQKNQAGMSGCTLSDLGC